YSQFRRARVRFRGLSPLPAVFFESSETAAPPARNSAPDTRPLHSPYRQTQDFVRPKAPQRIPPGQVPPQCGNTPPHGSNVVVVGRCGRVVVVLVEVVVVGAGVVEVVGVVLDVLVVVVLVFVVVVVGA